MLRRVIGVLFVIGGVTLIVVPAAEHVWSGAPPASSMVNSFKPVMTTASLRSMRADLQQLGAGDQQLATQVLPALAAKLHLTPAELQHVMATKFPAAATGIAQIPTIVKNFGGVGNVVQSQLANFRQVASFPTGAVPISALPWGLLAVGAAAMVLGALMLWRKSTNVALVAALVGVAVVVGALALSLPHKAVSTDHLISDMRPVISSTSANAMGHSLTVVGAAVTQLEKQVLPFVATQTKTPLPALMTFIETQFPAVGTTLKNMPSTSATFAGLQKVIAGNVSNYERAAAIPSVTFLVWIVVGVGLLLLLGGTVALLSGRSQQ